MPVLLTRYHCPACGGEHDLCEVGPGSYDPAATYTFTCPGAHKPVHVRPLVAGAVGGDCPPGAVEMRRADPGP
jgi:hypothetical protein